MKVQARNLTNKDRIETLDSLYTAAGTLNGRKAAKQFLKELLTESERIMLGRRILIARALLTGKTYDEIVDEFSVGKDTIRKISRWLNDQLTLYQSTIADMEIEFDKRKKARIDKQLYARSALYRLKKKYPMHFLLFPTPKSK